MKIFSNKSCKNKMSSSHQKFCRRHLPKVLPFHFYICLNVRTFQMFCEPAVLMHTNLHSEHQSLKSLVLQFRERIFELHMFVVGSFPLEVDFSHPVEE